MSFLDRRLRRLFRLERQSPAISDDVDAEIAGHLAMRCEELVAQGMSPEAAHAEARRQFGDVSEARAAMLALDRGQIAETRRREWWAGMVHDVRHALRLLRSAPAFTLVAVTTLALGIGASAAIFSVVHQILLRPLPFPNQQSLVRVWPVHPENAADGGAMSVPDLDDWRRTQRDFARLGGYWYFAGHSGVDLTGLGPPERLRAAQITEGFFETLGTAPELGRLPTSDELSEGGPRVAVISDGLWRRRFGADPAIAGRTVVLDQTPHIVVGVMPPAMRFPGDGPDVWIAALYQAQTATPWKLRANRWLSVVGRLAPGVTAERARADLATFQRTLAVQYPDADEGWTGARVVSLRDTIVGGVRPPLLILFAAAGCVLLVASANIAVLLLARAGVRAREFAVRAALGAPRSRIVQQILIECFVLSITGAAAGVLLAGILGPVLTRLAAGELAQPPGAILDWTVAAFTLAVAAVSTLVLAAPLAAHVLSVDATASFTDSGTGTRGATSGRARVQSRQLLVVAEVAIAVVLVCSASLMAKSFRRLLAANTGFQPEHALAIGFMISDGRYPDPRQFSRYYQTVLDQVRDIPGVIAAGATKMLPLRGNDEPWGFGIDGELILPLSQRPTVTMNHISSGYFRAVGTPLLAGREFTRGDTIGAPAVVIVNDVFAHRYLPGPVASAANRSLVFGDTVRLRIVGVVQSVHQTGLEAPPGPAAYIPATQNERGSVTLVVRVRAGDPLALAGAVQRAIWSADKDQTITSITTLDDVVRQSVARPRLLSLLLAGFGALGLLLGALGIYGVVAYSVDARRQEIGVRVALGASRRDVLALVVGRGMLLAMSGVLIGLVISLIATRVMRAVLFGIGPSDPATYIEVLAVLSLVAALAAYLPARRALAVDPVTALSGS